MKYLVIIPTYNEVVNIDRILPIALSLHQDLNVLVVDDNSQDGTADAVIKLQDSYPDRIHLLKRAGKLGLGTAYIAGFKYGLEREYDVLFEMDADFSHDPQDLLRMIHEIDVNKADVVVGSRYVTGGKLVNWPLSRRMISSAGSIYTRLITWMPIKDPTAGFIGYRSKVLRDIDLDNIQFVGYAFQIQMKFEAWIRGYKIIEIPITFKDREVGVSKMSGGIVKEAAFGVIAMKWKSLFRK